MQHGLICLQKTRQNGPIADQRMRPPTREIVTGPGQQRHLLFWLFWAYEAGARRLGHGNPSIALTVYAHLISNTDTRAAEIVETAFASTLAE